MVNFTNSHLKTPWQRLGARRACLLALCVIVGLLSGGAAVLMHNLAHAIAIWSRSWLSAQSSGTARYLLPLLPGVGIFLCVLFAKIFIRKRPYNRSLFTAIQQARQPGRGISLYHCFSHIVTCGTGVGLGISAGMEAPSALTGAAIGGTIAKWLRLPRETLSLLLSAGSAAGISSVFMAPLGGTLFACEVLLPRVNSVLLVPLLIAAAAGAIVSRCLLSGSAFTTSSYAWHTGNIWLYVAVGLICGLFSCMIIRLNCIMARLSGRLRNVWLKALIGSALLYLFFLLMPILSGQGYDIITRILRLDWANLPTGAFSATTASSAPLMLLMIFLSALLKPLVSMISLNSGGDGGMFGPSLVTGGFVGFACHLLFMLCGITGFPVINCVTAGMAGVLAGVMHAPLTGLFLIAELLGGYGLFIPLMIVVAISSFISKIFMRRNLYFATAAATQDITAVERVSEEGLSELDNTPVQLLADHHYITLTPTDSFRQFLQVLLHTNQPFFPVLDQKGKIIGMVNEKSIRPYILDRNLYDALIVDDFMEAAPDSIRSTATIAEAAAQLDASGNACLPVLDDDTGVYTGLIEKNSLLEHYRARLGAMDLF